MEMEVCVNSLRATDTSIVTTMLALYEMSNLTFYLWSSGMVVARQENKTVKRSIDPAPIRSLLVW